VVAIADGVEYAVRGYGTWCGMVKTSKKKKAWIEIHNVLHVPEMADRLLSTRSIRNSGGEIMLGKGGGKITFGNGVIVPLVLCEDSELECIKVQLKVRKETEKKDTMYKVVTRKVNDLWNATAEDELDINDLHVRFNHVEEGIIRKIVDEMNMKLNGKPFHCAACAAIKSKRNPFRKKAESEPDNYLHRIHGDAFGPFTVATCEGKQYGFMFADGKADTNGRRRKWLYLTENNSAEVGYHTIRSLIQTLESKHGKQMRVFRTDNGGEFTSTLIDQLLFEKNIERELTAADSP
jgi:hypothetical protein